ncbi:ORF6N domain-containing protein [Flavobacterium xinjiangense]|uniref:ORF6N domain-containing protein n=1 Tax=Flavobacterium xinjiangense TaxID=178356 RepID=A0A1M7F3H5_9FLAO|nr:ORF6N domain-containing protein [Flavobacterium xinjiangense]SHL98217.1 ORF6N domain-containing protein [Flavobacterium xinjiangense]
MNDKILIIPDDTVINKIYFIRNQKVMLDRDLATLYGVETRVLKQAVRRNLNRFPEDFMFELSKAEFENWRSQIVISNSEKMGLRYAPMAFTEHGVLMLSSVLNSEQAIQTNIQIMRIFTKTRQLLSDNSDLRIDFEIMKKKIENQGKNIELVFQYVDELMEKKEIIPEREKIGYKK